MHQLRWWLFPFAALLPCAALANPLVVDLATIPAVNGLLRAHGHTAKGISGVPVAGGFDVDGDVGGHRDFAFSALRASPQGRNMAGEVYLIFGDGSIDGTLDTGVASPDILTFIGDVEQENAGSEIWMDDVTGDGLGDLLIARQNYTPDPGRVGAGALTIVKGGPELRSFAATLAEVDLRAPPPSLTLTTILGAGEQFRLGIWVRTGDVTGDGIADIVVGADQTSDLAEAHRGAVWVIRGGSHLGANQTIDLANFGATPLAGHIARLTPPPGSGEFHLGATVAVADLDGNGSAEVLAAATLERAGAGLPPAGALGATHSSGGTPDGTLFIAWDDNFTGAWEAGFGFAFGSTPGSESRIDGASCNIRFGEEVLGGLDYDRNGAPDLFVGDIIGNCAPDSRLAAGVGHVLFDAVDLKDQVIDMQAPPPGLVVTDIFGAFAIDISSDTAFHGDFDRDGFADLGVISPHADPLGRDSAGAFHVLFGRASWPAAVDLAALPPLGVLRVTEVIGAQGAGTGDAGDTLGYSAATGDMDADGIPDVIVNEMVGNGLQPGSTDVGNLLILSGRLIAPPPVPSLGATGALLCLLAVAAVAWLGSRRRGPHPRV